MDKLKRLVRDSQVVKARLHAKAQPYLGKAMEKSQTSGCKEESASDEARFNETLKRMLRTPPKPHEKAMGDNDTGSKHKGVVAKSQK